MEMVILTSMWTVSVALICSNSFNKLPNAFWISLKGRVLLHKKSIRIIREYTKQPIEPK